MSNIEIKDIRVGKVYQDNDDGFFEVINNKKYCDIIDNDLEE